MTRFRRIRWVATCAMLAIAGSAWAGTARFEERLQQAVASGEVDAARADLYRLYSLRAPERLPQVLRQDPTGPSGSPRLAQKATAGPMPPERDGTALMRLLRERLAEAPEPVRTEAGGYLAAAPAAATPARAVGKDVARVLLNRVVTANFSVEWGPDLTNEMGLPWTDTAPSFADDPAVGGNGVPDVVERWAAYLEASYAMVLGELGFPADSLDTFLVPVYLGNSDPSTTIDDINSSQFFGLTDFRPGTQVPSMVVNNNLSALPLIGLTPQRIQELMRVTAAHEFFHVLHFLYEPPVGAAVWQEEIWWWEASATWMEDVVFDSVDDYHSWFQGTQGWPRLVAEGLAPHFNDADYAPRAYGGSIFAKYLEEHVGGRDSMRQVWERIRDGGSTPAGMRVLDAFDAYAVSRGFDGLDHLLVGFAGANAVMDYEDGAFYGQVPAPSPLSGTTPSVGFLGSAYRTRSSGVGTGVQLSVAGAPSTDWALSGTLTRSQGFSLVVGDRFDGTTTPVVRFATLGAGDSLFGAATWLTDGAPIPFTLAESAFTAADTTAPAAVGLGVPTRRAGGFDLSWSMPADPDVAGTVVRWRPQSSSSYTASRTLSGPATSVEIRGLPAGNYVTQAFAYDVLGNADPAGATAATVTVITPGADATIPNSPIVRFEPGTPPAAGGGGGGGGGCFLGALLD